MIPVGMLIIWAGYGLGSWGWCLVKGWDVPIGRWFNPVSPYLLPKAPAAPPPIPAWAVFPPSATAGPKP